MALPLMGQNFSRNIITVAPQTSSSPVGYVAFRELRTNGTHEVRLKAPDSLAATISLILPTALPGSTLCINVDTSGNMGYTSCSGGGGAGITTLNGLTNDPQSFAIGTSGIAPYFSSSSSTHTLHIPMAITTGVTAGLISKSEYDTFFNKQAAITWSSPLGYLAGTASCSTCATVSGTPTSGNLTFWTGTGNGLSNTGIAYDTSPTDDTIVRRFSDGSIQAKTGIFTAGAFTPTTSGAALVLSRGSAGQTDPIVYVQDQAFNFLSSINADGGYTGSYFKFNGSTSGTVTVQPAATAGTWTMTLPTTAGTASYFLQTDGSGNTTWASASAGGVGGSGTTGQAAEWSASTTLTGRNYASTTAGSASSVVKTGTNKEIFAYDYGAQVYNVHAYGAVGDGSTNDTTAIQAAINACQDGNGGTVQFLGKTYKIGNGSTGTSLGALSVLTVGNGSAGTGANTKKPCKLVGTGPGDSDNITAGTTLTWDTAFNPGTGTTKYMLDWMGPYEGGGLEGINFDTKSASNPARVLALRLNQVAHFKGSGINMIGIAGGPAMTFQPVVSYGSGKVNGCRGEFDRIMINSPGSSGEGILFADMVAGANPPDTCQVRMTNVTAHGTTYGMKVVGADNLLIERAELDGPSGYGLTFARSAVNTNFPHENTFISLSTNNGVGGAVGDGQANVFIDYKRGDCSTNCDIPTNITTGTKPIIMDTGVIGSAKSHWRGLEYYQAEVSADNSVEREYFRADVGASNLFKLSRPASSNDVKVDSYDGIQFNVPKYLWHYTDSNSDSNFYGDLYSSTGATDRYGLQIRRARGTKASPSNVADGDRLGLIAMWGRVNGSFNVGSIIETYADTTSSGTVMNSTLRIRTSKYTGSGVGTLASPGFVVSYKYVQYELGVYADLPTCASGTEGARARITDANTSTWDATVSSGGGSSRIFVICNGTNWKVDH